MITALNKNDKEYGRSERGLYTKQTLAVPLKYLAPFNGKPPPRKASSSTEGLPTVGPAEIYGGQIKNDTGEIQQR